nr:hypothetical protein [Tanacetum cinerariifolium]
MPPTSSLPLFMVCGIGGWLVTLDGWLFFDRLNYNPRNTHRVCGLWKTREGCVTGFYPFTGACFACGLVGKEGQTRSAHGKLEQGCLVAPLLARDTKTESARSAKIKVKGAVPVYSLPMQSQFKFALFSHKDRGFNKKRDYAATAGHWDIKKDEKMIKFDLARNINVQLPRDMQCTTTDDGYQFCDELEMSFVECSELFTPPPDEAVLSTHEAPIVSAHVPADILGSHDTSDVTIVPIRRIFDRLRNLLTDNVERDFVSQTLSALGKRPLSTTSFSHAYAEMGGALPAADQTISIDRNIRRRLTTAPSHNTVDATALLVPSELHVHADMMQDAITQELYSSRTGLRSASMPHEVNHAYLCLDSNDCIIRPEVISFPNRAEKPGVKATYLQNIQVIIPKLHNMKVKEVNHSHFV